MNRQRQRSERRVDRERGARLIVGSSLGAGLLLAAAGCGGTGSEAEFGTEEAALAAVARHPHESVCRETVAPGQARCFARARSDGYGHLIRDAAPAGLGAGDLRAAYNLPPAPVGKGRSRPVVAIVDAFDDPNAEADLATYRKQFGLPPCTTANGCFRKVNQDGVQGSYPSSDTGWAGEIALDLDMVSAGCPSCRILLVVANSESTDDLGKAVDTAARLGASAISNSYGANEDSTQDPGADHYYQHPGVLITASSGDSGFGVIFPASSPNVLAVGGTSLAASPGSARGWAEGAWDGAGSGCSSEFAKPSYQPKGLCENRITADVSAIADPNTGVAVFDSFGDEGGGWMVFGGTSASAPLVAAIFALTGNTGVDGSFPYKNSSAFFDVTTGSNGSCTPSALCHGIRGYDGPTGIGTPDGAKLVHHTGG